MPNREHFTPIETKLIMPPLRQEVVPRPRLFARLEDGLDLRRTAGSPAPFRRKLTLVVAPPAPSEREKSQMYFQRYMPHLPAGGEVVIFDRSWYNRAGVERVMGFATEEQVNYFLKYAPVVERAISHSGIVLIKY